MLHQELGGSIPQTDNIANTAGNIKTLCAFDQALPTVYTHFGWQVQRMQQVPGIAKVAIAIGIHIGSHKIRDGEMTGTLV